MMEMEGWIILHILHITYYSLFEVTSQALSHIITHHTHCRIRGRRFVNIGKFNLFPVPFSAVSFWAEKSKNTTITNRLGSSDPDYRPSHRVPSSPSSSLLPVQEDNSFLRLFAICFKFFLNLEGVQWDIRVVEVGHKNAFQMSLRTFTLTRSLPMVNSGSHPRWSHGGCN